ncbi:DNA-binding protein [Orientia tsutsugamushi]|uniref:Bacterial DNA-binding family protein n=2 Tax=Orientia tsutsugamushi TaxID=784 RepID=A0A0F3RNE4_ORITS|nr:HU family DNA-binding protein [Orientia tsutsugamushi]KJW07855.1 bacterial DNA-binding family protein [Orientia tsutsugamushi str. UT144]SPR04915.1 DNA-binding protein [Orientia tsutsugamushi]
MSTNNQERESLNKAEFVNFIHKNNTNMTKADIERALNLILRGVEKAIENGHDINIVGFGSFCVRFRAARDGHNPKTGAKIIIPESYQVVFKPGKTLKDACNN